MSLEVKKHESIYEYIELNFKDKVFDFNYHKNNSDIKLKYYEILKKYLNNKGYGYIANQIGEFIERREIDDIEVAKLLMDCNLINKFNKLIKSDLEDKKIVEYEQSDQTITKSFNISYSDDIPFNIDNVFYSNTEFISHQINNRKKEIQIEINIKPYKIVNFTDFISIDTTYGVDKLEITVRCKENNKYIELDNIEEFLQLCTNDATKAEKIFYKPKFEEWLKKQNNSTQLINYNQAKKISSIKNKAVTKFEVFCRLNGIYNREVVRNDPEPIDLTDQVVRTIKPKSDEGSTNGNGPEKKGIFSKLKNIFSKRKKQKQ